MGQRLVINIHESRKKETAMAVYFHWSGYSRDTAELLSELIVNCTKGTTILELIRYFEDKGGGLITESLQYAQQMFPNEKFKTDDISRNCGLIAMGPDIKDLNEWPQNYIADFYLAEREADSQVCYEVDQSNKEVMKRVVRIKDIDFDPMKMTLHNFGRCMDVLGELEKIGFYRFDGKIFGTI